MPEPMTPELHIDLPTEVDTLRLGTALAPLLQPGAKVYLSGDLGAGKTTLVRGMLRALGYSGAVKSPTYTLVELYNVSRLDLHHFDFYRFNHSDEWDDAGFREIFAGEGVCLVEWAERARAKLPQADIEIFLEQIDSGRRARLQAFTATGTHLLKGLRQSRY